MSTAIRERIASPEAAIPINRSLPKRYMSRAEVAQYTGIAASTINNLHTAGKGPKMMKVFGRVVYDIHDVDQWLASFKVDPATRRKASATQEAPAVKRGRGRPPKNQTAIVETRA
jgi:predicted DNA-binding transcriptional regulator AlpA